MVVKLIKDNKGVLLFIAMFLVFSFIASLRVERLEKNTDENINKMVYNK